MHLRGNARAVAVLVVCAALAGCAPDANPTARSTAPAPPPPSASTPTYPSLGPASSGSATPVSPRQARRQWHDALDSTAKELTGTYLWWAWGRGSDKPVAEEYGVFGLAPTRTAFERILRDPTSAGEDPTEYTIRVRRRGDTMYMQMADWGPWDGCWLHFTPDLVAQETGLELPDGPALPTPVIVALDAVVTGSSDGSMFADPYVELKARVSAIEAMQFLGLSPRLLVPDRERLTRVQVPIVVAIGVDDRVKGAAAWGHEIATALKRAHVRLRPELRQALPELSASVEFSNFGKGAEVRFPADRLVLPPGATKQRTCPAKAPLS